ncbi:MAG: hypothetical protein AAGD96_14660 [Chloroflexota bacterium]
MKVFFLLTTNLNLNVRLADGTVLGQILAQSLPYATDGAVFVTADNLTDDSQLSGVQNHARVTFADGTGNLAALSACRDQNLIPAGECLVITDGSLVIHNYKRMADEQSADIVSLLDRAFWFRSGAVLKSLLDWQSDQPLATTRIRPDKLVNVGDTDDLVLANKRLLGIGYSSKDALERSYTEEFGVIPPVFIHPNAEIYSSMIGPYVSIGDGTVVSGCVLENCIIDDGAQISNLNLKDSIIGRSQKVVGKPQSILKM